MEKYRKVVKPKSTEEIAEDEIRVTAAGSVSAYVSRVAKVFTELEKPSVTIKATGGALTKAVTLAEVVKRRFKGLHQITSVGSLEVVDEYEPIEEGLDPVTDTRTLTVIEIKISKEPLDTSDKGYQAPIDEALVTDYDPDKVSKSRGRGKGKGKSKGKGKGKKGADDAAARVHEIPIATDGVEEDFPWKDRILGERRRNADHVQRETGVKVWLTGKGTGDSDAPLTLSITASGAVGDTEFDKAVEMCEDLLEHIYEEAAGWAGADEDAEPGKGAKGKGKSKKGKSDGKGKDKGKEKGKGKDKDAGSKGKGKSKSSKSDSWDYPPPSKGKTSSKGKGKSYDSYGDYDSYSYGKGKSKGYDSYSYSKGKSKGYGSYDSYGGYDSYGYGKSSGKSKGYGKSYGKY